MNSEHHIVSFIIKAKDQAIEAIDQYVSTHSKLEGVIRHDGGKWIIVGDSSDARELMQCIEELRSISGVLSVELVAHHQEDRDELDRSIELLEE